jgi:hypothetical protein
MNMFMLQSQGWWGILIGLFSVGVPSVLLILHPETRGSGTAWQIALMMALLGGSVGGVVAIRKDTTTIARAAWIGSCAGMAAWCLASFLVFFFNPFVIVALPIPALLGAVMGTIAGGLLRWAGVRVAPPLPVVRRCKTALLKHGRQR